MSAAADLSDPWDTGLKRLGKHFADSFNHRPTVIMNMIGCCNSMAFCLITIYNHFVVKKYFTAFENLSDFDQLDLKNEAAVWCKDKRRVLEIAKCIYTLAYLLNQ